MPETWSSSIRALRTYSSNGRSSGVLIGPTARHVISFLLSPVAVILPTLTGAAPACLSAVTLVTDSRSAVPHNWNIRSGARGPRAIRASDAYRLLERG